MTPASPASQAYVPSREPALASSGTSQRMSVSTSTSSSDDRVRRGGEGAAGVELGVLGDRVVHAAREQLAVGSSWLVGPHRPPDVDVGAHVPGLPVIGLRDLQAGRRADTGRQRLEDHADRGHSGLVAGEEQPPRVRRRSPLAAPETPAAGPVGPHDGDLVARLGRGRPRRCRTCVAVVDTVQHDVHVDLALLRPGGPHRVRTHVRALVVGLGEPGGVPVGAGQGCAASPGWPACGISSLMRWSSPEGPKSRSSSLARVSRTKLVPSAVLRASRAVNVRYPGGASTTVELLADVPVTGVLRRSVRGAVLAARVVVPAARRMWWWPPCFFLAIH